MIRTEIHIVFFILIFGVALSVNATPQDDFNRAAYLMGQQEYEEAFEIYQEIEETGYMAGPLYLNMGISLVRMDSLGLAKYYFMRAGEFNQTRARAVDGLNYIDQEVERRSGSIPVLPSVQWWKPECPPCRAWRALSRCRQVAGRLPAGWCRQ